MQKSIPCKLTTVLAVCTGITCAISTAPGAACIAFALVAVAVLLFAFCVYFFVVILWLFSGGNLSVFSFGKSCVSFVTGMSDFFGPFAKFCFTYITPVATWVTLGTGILTVILAIITIAMPKKGIEQSSSETDTDIAVESETAIRVESRYPDPRARRRHKGKRRKKRKKTEKRTGVLCLALAIVFVMVAFAALFVANMIAPQL